MLEFPHNLILLNLITLVLMYIQMLKGAMLQVIFMQEMNLIVMIFILMGFLCFAGEIGQLVQGFTFQTVQETILYPLNLINGI